MLPIALTIAGSDPSGGAGIQADLKTFHRFGVYGEAVITLITVQNTTRVSAVEVLTPCLVREQIEAVLEDIPPHAAKTGALGSAEMVGVVADCAARFRFPLIVDPVMISKHGAPLMTEEARQALLERLLPHAAVLTPNLHEASALTGLKVNNLDDMQRAAERLMAAGARAVVVKGGHLEHEAADLLVAPGIIKAFAANHIDTPHTHGTGCTFAAAITAELAKGLPLEEAVASAKAFLHRAIATNPGLGHGSGPVNHFA